MSKTLTAIQSVPEVAAFESVDALILKRNELRKLFYDLGAKIRKLDEEISRITHSDYGVQLSDREREVLNLIMLDYVNKQIAAELGITTRTAAFHVTNLLAKFNLKGYSREDLIRKCRLK